MLIKTLGKHIDLERLGILQLRSTSCPLVDTKILTIKFHRAGLTVHGLVLSGIHQF